MEVWIVQRVCRGGYYNVEGVFASVELAKEFIAQCKFSAVFFSTKKWTVTEENG